MATCQAIIGTQKVASCSRLPRQPPLTSPPHLPKSAANFVVPYSIRSPATHNRIRIFSPPLHSLVFNSHGSHLSFGTPKTHSATLAPGAENSGRHPHPVLPPRCRLSSRGSRGSKSANRPRGSRLTAAKGNGEEKREVVFMEFVKEQGGEDGGVWKKVDDGGRGGGGGGGWLGGRWNEGEEGGGGGRGRGEWGIPLFVFSWLSLLAARFLGSMPGGRVEDPRFWTVMMITLNVMIFLLCQVPAGSLLITRGAKVNHLIRGGQYWRLLTSSLLHVNLLHCLVNMNSLYNLGTAVTYRLGSKKMLAIYWLSALGSGFSSFCFCPNPSVGASGAIFGLMGALAVTFWRESSTNNLKSVIKSAALSMAMGLFGHIDNFGHLGGFGGGVLAALLLGTQPPQLGWQ